MTAPTLATTLADITLHALESARTTSLWPCPACARPGDAWWAPTLPVAGLRRGSPEEDGDG